MEEKVERKCGGGGISIRLRGYDYASQGAYFVTIVTDRRRRFFGSIEDGSMRLSPIGDVVEECWRRIPDHFRNARIDVHQVMPDHFHGILFLDDLRDGGGILSNSRSIVQLNDATGNIQNATAGTEARFNAAYFSKISPRKETLSVIVRTFKAAVTSWCRKNGYPDFGWQRGFYDVIIRRNSQLDSIRRYVLNNPENL